MIPSIHTLNPAPKAVDPIKAADYIIRTREEKYILPSHSPPTGIRICGTEETRRYFKLQTPKTGSVRKILLVHRPSYSYTNIIRLDFTLQAKHSITKREAQLTPASPGKVQMCNCCTCWRLCLAQKDSLLRTQRVVIHQPQISLLPRA